MVLRISQRMRLILGICILATLGRHFQSFLQVHHDIKHVDDFQQHQDMIHARREEEFDFLLEREEVEEEKEQHLNFLPVDNADPHNKEQRQAQEMKKAEELLEEGLKYRVDNKGETGNQITKPNIQAPPASSTDTELQALQNSFYQDHYQSLYELSDDNLLVWKAQDDPTADEVGGGDNSSFSHFWEHFEYYHSPNGEELVPFNVSNFLRIDDSICRVALSFNEHLNLGNHPSFLKQVVLLRLDKDVGGFTSAISNETGLPHGKDLIIRWNEEGCSEAKVFQYVSHPNTRAIFTTQYQVYNERKIHSIPLGLRSHEYARKILHRTKLLRGHSKRTLFLLADIPPNDNDNTLQKVFDRFKEIGYPVQNTHGSNIQNYLDKLTTSKFMLLPNGFADSYQLWEALFSGCIPVLQHFNRVKDGWFRTTDDLPVAWIDSYDNLTPHWLEQEYEKLLKKHKYKWQKLTQQWWIEFIKSFVPTEVKMNINNSHGMPSSNNADSNQMKGGASSTKDIGKITREAAEKACANNAGAVLENCIKDVLATQDLEVAEAY